MTAEKKRKNLQQKPARGAPQVEIENASTEASHGEHQNLQTGFASENHVESRITMGNIENANNVAIGQNIRINVTKTTGLTESEIMRIFSPLLEKIYEMSDDPAKKQATIAVQGLRQETMKGEQANAKRINRLLRSLFKIAPDVWEVAVDSFINPVKGLSTVFQKVARRAREEEQN